MTYVLAILLGTAFGFALNRAGAANPQYIINMVRLTDLRLMKIILFAIGLSSLLLFGGLALGVVEIGNLSVKTAHWGVIVGGMILGLGFAIAGYCPGTGLAALAAGRRDGIPFLLGGFAGAFAYVLAYGAIEQTGIFGKIAGGSVTLAQTGAEKYPSLLPEMPALAIAGGIAVVLMVIAFVLPREKEAQ